MLHNDANVTYFFFFLPKREKRSNSATTCSAKLLTVRNEFMAARWKSRCVCIGYANKFYRWSQRSVPYLCSRILKISTYPTIIDITAISQANCYLTLESPLIEINITKKKTATEVAHWVSQFYYNVAEWFINILWINICEGTNYFAECSGHFLNYRRDKLRMYKNRNWGHKWDTTFNLINLKSYGILCRICMSEIWIIYEKSIY